jgi:K+-sensing histidine kinase KdpD/CheY-like chemotaxis protein
MFKLFTLGNFLRQVFILTVAAICILFHFSLQAQGNSETGLPLITNYNPDVRPNVQTWTAAEDSRGIMYFGAAKGILEYDGTKWREVKAERPDYMDAVRTMTKDGKGNIYFGAVGEIGYLGKDSTGLMIAKSLIQLVPEKDRNFLAVWSINIAGDDVYFQSRENLIRINPVTKAVKVWKPETRFLYTFYLDNTLFVHQQGKGLSKIVNEQLEFIPGSEFTGDERMQVMLPYPSENGMKRYLVGLFYSGLYVFDGKSFTKLKTEADGIFKNALLYKGILLDEQTYAISTAGSGLVLINPQGKLLKIYNKAIGLQDESIYGLYKDSRNKLWLALDVGISRVDYDAPYSIFSAPSGINSSTLILTRFKGDLFLGTTNGLLKYNQTRRLFERIEGVPSHQIFDLVIDGDDLLVPGDGLFAYRQGKVRLLKASKGGDLSIVSLKIPQTNPNLLFAGTSTGLVVFSRRANEQWKMVGNIPDVVEPVWSIAEEKDGKIWAGTQNGFAYLIVPAYNNDGSPDLKNFKIDTYDETHGWTKATGQVIELEQQVYFIGAQGFFNFDQTIKKFKPDTILGKLTKGGGDEESELTKDQSGRVWIHFGKVTYTATPKPDGTFDFDTTPFLPLTEKSISRIYPENNGITWFTVTEGVLRYDENLKKDYSQSYKTIITSVVNDKNHLNPVNDLNGELPEISYRNNTLRFDFAAPFFEQEKQTQYQTWLEGFENEWSEFGTNHYKEYTNLPSGQYTFHVRAKNVYNKLSEESIFSISVTPPWYATWWAYLLYALAGAGIIALIVRYRTLHLREQHRELEKIVAVRTHELSQRVEELAVINSVQESLVKEIDMDGIYHLIGEKIREIFNAQVIDIVIYDADTNIIEDRYAYEKGDTTKLGPRELSGFRKPVVESGDLLVINKNVLEISKQQNVSALIGDVPKSLVIVPMKNQDKVTGMISLQDLDKEDAFSEADVNLLKTLANSMSVALESARRFDETNRLLKETKQRNAELGVINSVQDGLVREMNIQGIYDLVGEKIREIFNAQVIDIVMYDPKTNMIEDRYAYEKGDRSLIGAREPKGFRKHVLESKQPLFINRDYEKTAVKYNNDVIFGEVPKSVAFVPLLATGEVKGIISLQNLDHENAFSESDHSLLMTLSNSMSVALESARLFDETTRLLKETEQRNAELAVINSVQDGLVAHLDIQHIYDLVGEKIREIFNAQVIDIVTYDQATDTIEDKYAYEKGDRTLIGKRPAIGFRKHVIETRQLLLHNENVEEEALKFGNVTLHGEMAKSQVFVPMIAGGEIKGIISLQNLDNENAFKESDVRLLTTLANSMSVALEGARLFDETKRLLLETEQRTAELAVINSVQEGLVREMDAESIYELVGEKMRQIFNAQVIDIVTYDRNANIIEDRYAYEKGDRSILAPRAPYGYRKHVIDTKQILVLNDKMEEYAKQYGNKVMLGEMTKSAVFVPMMESNEVTGIVSLQNIDQEHAFSESDIRLLVTLSNSLSIALQNARLFEETSRLLAESKQRMTELSTVNSVSKALASQLNPEELINLVGNKMKDLFNANIVYLALLNQKTKIIYFPYQFGDNLVPMKLGEGLTSHVIITGEPLLLNKEQEGAHTTLGFQRVGIPAASYLGVPIPDGDNIIGVLSVQSTEKENRFTENDQRLLSTIAASVGVALRNAQLFEEVQLAKLEAETASKIAEKANEAKSAFLSTVSHELRTPLTSVLGFAKIIRKRLEEKIFPLTDVSDPKTTKTIQQVSDNLSVVVSEGERLTHLINDVLDLAKIEAGKMEWSEEWLSIADVVDRASSATSTLFDQKNLLLVKHFEDDIPQIRGDKDKLIQVVVNLLSNAVKFTDAGSVTCKIRKHEGELIVDVTDTGIGIAPEDHSAVFEQFKQVGDTLTDKPKGTGLGLPICKEIVEHHGGRIWLTSEPGKGSTFSFSIPVETVKNTKPLALNDLVLQLREQMAESVIPGANKHATILIVDDDDSIRSLLYQELSEAGYQINEASNGKEALISIRKHRPDLIILDVMMPEMNGFDVAAVLKNDPQTMDIPIIVLSIVQDKARGFRIGVDRYLTKPIDTGVLFTEVDSLLQQGKSRKKVLVVDEDSSTVKSLVEVLKAKGYSVVEAVGEELIQTAISNQPDIIIVNALLSGKQDYAEALRMEKGLENVLFLVYQ